MWQLLIGLVGEGRGAFLGVHGPLLSGMFRSGDPILSGSTGDLEGILLWLGGGKRGFEVFWSAGKADGDRRFRVDFF